MRDPRYVVAAPPRPGPDRSNWWEISDTVKDFAVVTIHRDLPNAEQEARELCDRLNAQEQG